MLLQSCPTLCDPTDSSPRGFAIPGFLQARTLDWVAISFSNAWKWKVKSESEVAQSCLILRDPMDRSLPGSSIHGIFQARVLEWVAIAFSISLLAAAAAAKSLQLCLILCDPIEGSPPGSPIPGILKARTLEWVAIRLLWGFLYYNHFLCWFKISFYCWMETQKMDSSEGRPFICRWTYEMDSSVIA